MEPSVAYVPASAFRYSRASASVRDSQMLAWRDKDVRTLNFNFDVGLMSKESSMASLFGSYCEPILIPLFV